MAEKAKETKQKYQAITLEEYLTQIKDNTIPARERINLALNAMLKGRKIIGTMNRKGLNYYIVEEV